MNLLRRLKTLWVLSGWDIQKNKKEGAFTIDGILRPQIPEEKPRMAQIIKRKDPIEDFLKKTNE